LRGQNSESKSAIDFKHLFLSFEGRISRQPFWIGILTLIGIAIALAIIELMIGLSIDVGEGARLGILSGLFMIASIWFSLALYAKRWHDRDKSGWWSLIAFIPIVGAIWIIVELGCLQGTEGPNRFGPDPLAG
jgi:uncharacterized membrane protein YhaH (DUF805 family)